MKRALDWKFIPSIEVALHRGLWSFIFLLFFIILFGKIKEFFLIFTYYKRILILSTTAILITINWTGFIYAISINRLQDASMGYFMTPMISIILGYFFLKENISLNKLISVLMMLSATIFLTISLKIFPFLAILIGTSWGIYGLLRKQINVSSEIGLLYESGFISLLSLPFIIYLYLRGHGFFLNYSNEIDFYLIFTGLITIFPLFFFNLGVKKIPLGFAGVIFYLAPSFHFFTSIFILNEQIKIEKMISFVIIWIAVFIFVFDIFKDQKKINENNIQ